MSGYTPAKVFASISSSAKVKNDAANQVTKTHDIVIDSNKEKMDRLIQVTAVGEVSLPPDRCRINVKVHSVKDNVQDVKNSIQRRLDYVLQTFQNHNVKDVDIQVHKSMRRVESMYEIDAEVVVIFLDFHKCQSASNLLVEKLDESVTVSLPEFYHAGTTLETLRQQASLLAVHNAKQKAQEMAGFVHQAVGKPITIQEEESKEWEGQVEGGTDMEPRPTIQQRMSQATVTVSCRVNVTFELKPKVKTKSMK